MGVHYIITHDCLRMRRQILVRMRLDVNSLSSVRQLKCV